MAFPLFQRNRGDPTIEALYGAIVAQARHPVFYAEYRISDTVEGRFDMLALHVALFFRRVRDEPGEGRDLGQRVFDRFCRDMEDSLRELGVSDLGVPKQMRRLGGTFYGRLAAYDQALAAPDAAVLIEVLRRNLTGDGITPDVPRLARYVRAAADALAGQVTGGFAGGALHFPAPGVLLPEVAL